MSREQDYTPSTWRAAVAKSTFRLPISPKLRGLMSWHYRCSVVNCWGSLELRQLYKSSFDCPGDGVVASYVLFETGISSSTTSQGSSPFHCSSVYDYCGLDESD